ncbi:MATE family efflux transporter [Isoalcanivorax beigongshangi]|uniref:MATE family efflux transporter n=1 Tax=Isoalcanivorax beigongshangi TaxID=3238810 RepID=A0ABV4AE94_9GAMM
MPPAVSAVPPRPFWQTFSIFVLPLVLTNILQSLAGTVNTVFVGQLLGVEAVAAVSVFLPILLCLLAFVIGLSSGTTVVVGQAWGAKNPELVRRAAGNAVFLTLVASVTLSVFGLWQSKSILMLLGTDPAILSLALPYFHVMMAGLPLIFLQIVYTALLRGVGDSLSPLYAWVLTIAVGLTVTPMLIHGSFGLPQLGTMAPAVANLIGNTLAITLLIILQRRGGRVLQVDRALLAKVRFDAQMTATILRLGIPTGVQMITTAVAGLVLIGLINQFGSAATASYGAVAQVINYIQFPALSIGIACSIFAAQAIGARRPEQVAVVTRTASIMNLVITGGLILLAYLTSRHLTSLFITDDEVLELAQGLLHIALWSILCFGGSVVLSGTMRASGTVWTPMAITLSVIILVQLPLAWWLSRRMGLDGIWYAYAVNFTLGFALQWAYYQWVWKKRPLVALDSVSASPAT